jgi:hypothetical protein
MKYIFFTILISSLISCSQSKFVVAPAFTSVDKISKISQGDDFDKVNSLLGVGPYDIIYLNNNDFLCYYNYRLLERKMNIDNSNKNRKANKDNHLSSETSQTFGSPFYTDWKKLYVSFSNGSLSHYTSDTGMERANYIQLVNGTITLLNKKDLLELNNFYEIGSPTLLNPIVGDPNKLIENGTGQDVRIDVDKLLFQLDKNGRFCESTKSNKSFIPNFSKRIKN